MIHTCKITYDMFNNVIAPNFINLIHYQNKAYQKRLSRKQQEFVHVITIDFSLQSQS